MATIFTFPGKIGDALLEWPIAAAWHKQTGKPYSVWMDKKTCKPLVNLIVSQPGVEEVKLIDGIENYGCGGQPYHFNMGTEDYGDNTVYHLGMHALPERQITLQTALSSKVPLDTDGIKWNPSLTVKAGKAQDRVVIHGQALCPHTNSVPSVWRFVNRIRETLESTFAQIYLVGTKDDLEAGRQVLPDANTFDDEGDMLPTADLISNSRMVIGAGSSIAALAGALGVPCVRVHDNIGTLPKSIWSNLGANQLNATEIELRSEFPEWFDKCVVNPEA